MAKRVVGLSGLTPKWKLATIRGKNVPMAIGNCTIKESADLKVVIHNSSDIYTKITNIDVEKLKSDPTVTINLDELCEHANFQNVAVEIKGVAVYDVVKVQDRTTDATASRKIVAWEENVGLMRGVFL